MPFHAYGELLDENHVHSAPPLWWPYWSFTKTFVASEYRIPSL